jgi:hypothetical protein
MFPASEISNQMAIRSSEECTEESFVCVVDAQNMETPYSNELEPVYLCTQFLYFSSARRIWFLSGSSAWKEPPLSDPICRL